MNPTVDIDNRKVAYRLENGVLLCDDVSKAEIERRMLLLSKHVQDSHNHKLFQPGTIWWLATDTSKAAKAKGIVTFWEQLGVSCACFDFHFGKRKWKTLPEKLVPPFHLFRIERCAQQIPFITVQKSDEWSTYGNSNSSALVHVDRSWDQVPVGRLRDDILREVDAKREAVEPDQPNFVLADAITAYAKEKADAAEEKKKANTPPKPIEPTSPEPKVATRRQEEEKEENVSAYLQLAHTQPRNSTRAVVGAVDVPPPLDGTALSTTTAEAEEGPSSQTGAKAAPLPAFEDEDKSKEEPDEDSSLSTDSLANSSSECLFDRFPYDVRRPAAYESGEVLFKELAGFSRDMKFYSQQSEACKKLVSLKLDRLHAFGRDALKKEFDPRFSAEQVCLGFGQVAESKEIWVDSFRNLGIPQFMLILCLAPDVIASKTFANVLTSARNKYSLMAVCSYSQKQHGFEKPLLAISKQDHIRVLFFIARVQLIMVLSGYQSFTDIPDGGDAIKFKVAECFRMLNFGAHKVHSRRRASAQMTSPQLKTENLPLSGYAKDEPVTPNLQTSVPKKAQKQEDLSTPTTSPAETGAFSRGEQAPWIPRNKAGDQKSPQEVRRELQAFMERNSVTKAAILKRLGVNSNSFRKFMTRDYLDPWRATENGTYWAAARLIEEQRNAVVGTSEGAASVPKSAVESKADDPNSVPLGLNASLTVDIPQKVSTSSSTKQTRSINPSSSVLSLAGEPSPERSSQERPSPEKTRPERPCPEMPSDALIGAGDGDGKDIAASSNHASMECNDQIGSPPSALVTFDKSPYEKGACAEEGDSAPFFIALSDFGADLKNYSQYCDSKKKEIYRKLSRLVTFSRDVMKDKCDKCSIEGSSEAFGTILDPRVIVSCRLKSLHLTTLDFSIPAPETVSKSKELWSESFPQLDIPPFMLVLCLSPTVIAESSGRMCLHAKHKLRLSTICASANLYGIQVPKLHSNRVVHIHMQIFVARVHLTMVLMGYESFADIPAGAGESIKLKVAKCFRLLGEAKAHVNKRSTATDPKGQPAKKKLKPAQGQKQTATPSSSKSAESNGDKAEPRSKTARRLEGLSSEEDLVDSAAVGLAGLCPTSRDIVCPAPVDSFTALRSHVLRIQQESETLRETLTKLKASVSRAEEKYRAAAQAIVALRADLASNDAAEEEDSDGISSAEHLDESPINIPPPIDLAQFLAPVDTGDNNYLRDFGIFLLDVEAQSRYLNGEVARLQDKEKSWKEKHAILRSLLKPAAKAVTRSKSGRTGT